jgi:tetrapyrrole methylase family protein/MazG family protein
MTTTPEHAKPTIVVVGLGPGGLEHTTEQTLKTLERIPHRYLRTSVHPTASLVKNATSFDSVYEHADTFEDVYAEIADRLVSAAFEHDEIVYAVPGSPLVLEQTVRHVRQRDEVDCVILPAMSFLDVAWSKLRIDPVEAGIRLVDGHTFAESAAGERGPLLVAHTHANWVLSDIKLAVEGASGDEEVTILQALGTDAEQIVTTTWADLDRSVEADHLTSIYIPELTTAVGAGYVAFHELTRTLREQCPWDIEQTHESLVPYLLEETYEVVDAVQGLDPDNPKTDDNLIEELGDLLYQIEFHATIAEQEGRFTIADVTAGIHDKLVRRHPHVFGDVAVEDSTEVLANWDDIKKTEKGRTSIFEGIPRSMPSLSYGTKIGRKASKVGFDWPDVEGAFTKIEEEANELRAAIAADDRVNIREELGDLLFAIVNVARHLDIDAELALRAASDKFRSRFEGVEELARQRTIDLKTADLEVLEALWNEVKESRAAE